MACNTSKLTGDEKHYALTKAIVFYRSAQRVLLQDVALLACRKAKKSIDAKSMTKFVTSLDAGALKELGITLERKGAKGPVTVVFEEPARQPAAERASVAA